jgi:hypothetical protein
MCSDSIGTPATGFPMRLARIRIRANRGAR